MKKKNKLLSFLMAAVMCLALVAPVAAAGDTETYSAVVRFDENADVAAVSGALEEMAGVKVRWTYEALFKGAAVEGTARALERIEGAAGVSAVALSRTWAQPAAVGDPVGTSNSLDVMNGESVEYDGNGMVIAVIDSGLYVIHETFQDYGMTVDPALSEENVDAFVQEGGTDGRYISAKIPFAYDYSHKDRSVHTTDAHGTHVSALAVGYAENADGTVKFRGVAPAAQLLAMKVFSDNAEQGARDEDILKAMEDAYLLGADVVNLSLGTEGDFVEEGSLGSVYKETIKKMREAGIAVCCAAGNSANAVYSSKNPDALPTADFTDYGTACLPAALPGAIGVSAVTTLTRDGGGGLVVGDQTIPYVKGVSEDIAEILPDIDDLAGERLPYVVIEGLGAPEDFEGLDLTGCVALVKRGELYFTEKVNNAAAAGAVACLICNTDDSLILAAVTGTTIPCAVITLTAGEYFASQAVDGRGTVLIAPQKIMIDKGEELTIQTHSSWGATSDLRLASVLSAPGGDVLSAISGGRDKYGYSSGTSMATPNASGSFAVVMQMLKERGVEDKAERLRLAESLLTGTASVLTDGEGTPLSPRRQGAGVIDLGAAVESGVVVFDPVLELGENSYGWFHVSFVVKNISEEPVRLAVDTTVLTDNFSKADGRYYSTLSPLDITEDVTVYGNKAVTLRAGEERKVTVSITVDRTTMDDLAEVFPYGFFTEGFVTLTDEAGEQVHATFMGFCGDWEAAPVIEQIDFRDIMDARMEYPELEGNLELVMGQNLGWNLPYLVTEDASMWQQELLLGENPWIATAACDERIAMATRDTDALNSRGYQFSVELFTLRNAAHVVALVTDRATGEIYKVTDYEGLLRSDMLDTLGRARSAATFTWDGTDANGKFLPHGTRVDVRFYAWTQSDTMMQNSYANGHSDIENPRTYSWLTSPMYRDRMEWEFPLTLDGKAPEVSVGVDGEDVVLTVTDDRFVAYTSVYDENGVCLGEDTFAGEQAGASYEMVLLTGETLPRKLYITTADYAGNITGYEVEMSETGVMESVSVCPMAMYTDTDKGAWYHEAVDFVFENDLMDGTSPVTFSPEQVASRSVLLDVLYRMAGTPYVGNVDVPFPDVQDHDWCIDAIRWAYSTGVATGYNERLFGAFAPITRQQAAILIRRAAALRGEDVSCGMEILADYSDESDISAWAAEDVAWAVREGYLSPDGEGRLSPRRSLTRAELAEIIMTLYENQE